MAKKAYDGVDNLARNVIKVYGGVNDIAQTITKGYAGVEEISRQWWALSSWKYDTVIFVNGDFTQVTSPNVQTKNIVFGGAINNVSADSNTVVANKNLAWCYGNASIASYPWTISADIISGDIYNVSGSDNYGNVLAVAVDGNILTTDGDNPNNIGSVLRITVKGTTRNGVFLLGIGGAIKNGNQWYIPTFLYLSIDFGNDYDLDEYHVIDFELTNSQILTIRNLLFENYFFVFLDTPLNNGNTPKVYIQKIELLGNHKYNLVFEYDYQRNQTYPLHSDMDIYEFITYATRLYCTKLAAYYDTHLNWMKDHISDVLGAIFEKLEPFINDNHLDPTIFAVGWASSSSQVSFTLEFSTQALPYNATITSVKQTGSRNNEFYTMSPYFRGSYRMTANVKSTGVTAYSPSSTSGGTSYSRIGEYWTGSSSQNLTILNIGLKME